MGGQEGGTQRADGREGWGTERRKTLQAEERATVGERDKTRSG